MEAKKNLIWIASYPKSGNTWFRAFLANYLSDSDSPVNINNLKESPIFSCGNLFEQITGIDPAYLKPSEYDRLRPEIFAWESAQREDLVFHKVHDAFVQIQEGKSLIPVEETRAALYFIRNPMDVAVSFASHLGAEPGKVIENMSNEKYSLGAQGNRWRAQLRQRLLTWSMHVESWTGHGLFPVKVIRYEDIIQDPYETFYSILTFLGINPDPDRMEKGVKFSAFGQLRQQEETTGFNEKPASSQVFFRKGLAGSYKEILDEAQIQKIIDAHCMVMTKFGYLTKDKKPVF
jgi:hypothetical protein